MTDLQACFVTYNPTKGWYTTRNYRELQRALKALKLTGVKVLIRLNAPEWVLRYYSAFLLGAKLPADTLAKMEAYYSK